MLQPKTEENKSHCAQCSSNHKLITRADGGKLAYPSPHDDSNDTSLNATLAAVMLDLGRVLWLERAKNNLKKHDLHRVHVDLCKSEATKLRCALVRPLETW